MFTVADTPVKFVGLLILFVFCTVWCAYELSRPQDGRQRVSNLLHLGMAVVMLLMVARPTWQGLTAVIPTAALAVLFGAATLWFVGVGVSGFRARDRAAGRHGLGHAAMFAAMTWHVAAMAALASMMSGAGHGGMAEGGMQQGGGLRLTLAVIGLPLMVYLLVASIAALVAAVSPPASGHAHTGASCHEVRPTGSVTDRLSHLSDVAMNFGMFWMSTGLMAPLLPFMAAFAF